MEKRREKREEIYEIKEEREGEKRVTEVTKTTLADPGGFLGFRGTPLFVVLRACVAGLVRAHERSKAFLDSGTPFHNPIYIRHWTRKEQVETETKRV